MTQEEKDLLLKDLCVRLPYGVKCYSYCFKIDGNHCECYGTLDSIKLGVWYPFHLSNRISINNGATYEETFSEVKPYLFPLSSMTEEQKEELYKIGWYLDEDKIYSCFRNYDDENYKTHTDCFELINWCYKNNFDINGLIPMGLAIDATGLNVY